MSKTVKRKAKAPNSNIWDDFWGFVKQNEKVFWVVLLVLISFSFAFPTGAVFQSFGRDYPKLRLFGETVYASNYKNTGDGLERVQQMRGQTYGVLRTAGMLDEVPLSWFTTGFSAKDPLSMVDYFLYQKEADRLGIFVSDAEVADEALLHYHAARALQEASRTPTAETTGQVDTEALATELKALRESRAFNVDEWSRLLKRRGMGTMQGFERALRDVVRASKVVDYVRESAQVTEDEVWERFLSEEELRKISFFKVEDDGTLKSEIGAKITDADLRKHYDENVAKFAVNERAPKLRVSYVYFPYQSLKDQIEPSEEDLEAHYLKIRDSRYPKPLDVDTTSFELLTPEEEKEREAKMYTPLEEVREEVLEDYIETETRKRARELGDELSKQIFPPPPAEVDRGEVVKKLLEERDFLETGTTPFVTRYEVSEKAPKVNSSLLGTWFTNLAELDPTKKRPVELSKRFTETQDREGLVLYTEVETLQKGQESFEKLIDLVREDLEKIRVLESLESRAEALVEQIEKGEGTLASAAEQSGSRLLESSYQKRTGQIWVPVDESEEERDEEGEDDQDDDETDGRPKTEYLPASRSILGKAFSLTEGELAAVSDSYDGVAYVIRLDGRIPPAPQDFDESQKSRQRTALLNERREAYLVKWRKELWARADVKQYEYKS